MAYLVPVLAGVALVVQNLLLAAALARGTGMLAALLVNSAVGILFIVATGLARHGAGFLGGTLARFEPWFLLPGLLGTFVVFAGLSSYRLLGATATVTLVVAAQLLAGLLADRLGLVRPPRTFDLPALLGIGLLILGALLVLRRPES